MFIKFKNYRISLLEKIGETGFKTSIYSGSKRVATAEREDGKIGLEDITVHYIDTNAKKELRKMTINKKRIFVDNVEQEWTEGLIVYSLIENKSIYEKLKKISQNNKLAVRFSGEDFFSVVSGYKNTPEAINILKKKEGVYIEETGSEIIQFYEDIRQS